MFATTTSMSNFSFISKFTQLTKILFNKLVPKKKKKIEKRKTQLPFYIKIASLFFFIYNFVHSFWKNKDETSTYPILLIFLTTPLHTYTYIIIIIIIKTT